MTTWAQSITTALWPTLLVPTTSCTGRTQSSGTSRTQSTTTSKIALDSLKQLAQLKTQLAHKPAAAANSPLQAWAIFLDDFGQALADNLAEEGFANYWRSRPDSATYECYVTATARVGQKLLEDWLK